MAGAGIVGLSLALELRTRGYGVAVFDAQRAMGQASWAAAGMLAAEDPHNPPKLLPLSRLSLSLYPDYLQRVEALSGQRVPFQTETVVEYLPDGSNVRRPEYSLDPRQLAAALMTAVRKSGILLREDVGDVDVHAGREAVTVQGANGQVFQAGLVVHATGAWFQGRGVVRPRKGQMLRVQMSEAVTEVHSRGDVYIVPRTQGPQAGTALIGATVEDAGFDLSTHSTDLEGLRAKAAELLPLFGDRSRTPAVESWAGLRPMTPDGLPLIGALEGSPREFVATGHYRNGVLLAPGTAVVMCDLIEGKAGRVELAPYDAERFLKMDSTRTTPSIFAHVT